MSVSHASGRAAVTLIVLMVGCTESTTTPVEVDVAVEPVEDSGQSDDVGPPDADLDGDPGRDEGSLSDTPLVDTEGDDAVDVEIPVGDGDGHGDGHADVNDVQLPDFVACDATDEAWTKQVLSVLLGRRPGGLREVRVLEDMIQETSRAAVARGLMRHPEFLIRWSRFLMDELRVNRVGDKANPECYGAPQVDGDSGQIAAFVRDNIALSDAKYTEAFNMADVVRSSLVLDDLSPIYRAHLFAMMVRPITGANVDALQLDITRRQDFGEIFEATYLHRNIVCAGCHNSQFSTTDNGDPALDRHWPLPGLFEQAIYGASNGRPEMEFYSNFRHIDLVRESGGKRPWRLASSCGRLTIPSDLPADPAQYNGWFIEDQGKTASVWNVEDALRRGFQQLRKDGMLVVDPETLAVDGPAAFAYLVSVRITNQVWREVMGYPLTLVHYFPRTEAQRDLLAELTNTFISSGFSLKALLTAILTGPYFNENAPVDGCGSQDSPYVMPALFNPWILLETEPELHGNSVGDILHRLDARVLLNAAEKALLWPATLLYPDELTESFQKAVGVFVKDAEPGFDGIDFQGLLAWEARMGRCSLTDAPEASAPEGTCADVCGQQALGGGCYCDDQCTGNGDCCADYIEICLGGEPPGPVDDGVQDWFDDLVDTVDTMNAAGDAVTVGDVAIAIKDRLITAPDLTPGEAGPLNALFGVENLDTPLSGVTDWLGRAKTLCGALLLSPQFLIDGASPPDQTLPPRLVVGDTSYQAFCQDLGRTLFPTPLWTVECGEGTVTVTPFAPPLGGAPADTTPGP